MDLKSKLYSTLFKFEPSTEKSENGERMYNVYYRESVFSEFKKIGTATVFPGVSYRFSTLAYVDSERTAYIEKKCRELMHSKK